jgi:hypothetical protein
MVQLCYVVPRPSLKLLPEKIWKTLLKEHDEWYKTDCEYTWAYCKYFWESHVELPEIDIETLENLVNE